MSSQLGAVGDLGRLGGGTKATASAGGQTASTLPKNFGESVLGHNTQIGVRNSKAGTISGAHNNDAFLESVEITGAKVSNKITDARIALVAQVVVTAVQCQVALIDAVHADILASHAAQAATVEHRASGITVLQAADLIGQARIGIAIDLGLGVGDNIQQRLGDGQVIALVAQVVYSDFPTTFRNGPPSDSDIVSCAPPAFSSVAPSQTANHQAPRADGHGWSSGKMRRP